MKDESDVINVEVVYALPHEQRVFSLTVDKNQTVEEIINASGVLKIYPEIDLAVNRVGVYSRLIKLNATVRERDRIEIYRPLLADPKEIRRKRAEQAKAENQQKQATTKED